MGLLSGCPIVIMKALMNHARFRVTQKQMQLYGLLVTVFVSRVHICIRRMNLAMSAVSLSCKVESLLFTTVVPTLVTVDCRCFIMRTSRLFKSTLDLMSDHPVSKVEWEEARREQSESRGQEDGSGGSPS